MAILKIILIVLLLLPHSVVASSSICYGSTDNGKLENGVSLPVSGPNFISYSRIASAAGRTYVHSEVKEIILAAYSELESELPNKRYKYAETGYKNGGLFKPHKTHQNGLSADFMTPVIDIEGNSVHLPTNPFNKFGYDVEFDTNNQFNGLKIDYEAMAAHIVALHKQAKQRNHDLWRVIFDPQLQPFLYETAYADYLKEHILFSKKRSWVRHDEHYHVDFSIPCKAAG